MYVAEVEGKYISGVFQKSRDLEAYMKRVPEELRSIQVVKELPLQEYPIFILEEMIDEKHIFSFYPSAETMEKDLQKKRSKKNYHLTTFDITEDYFPKNPGEDEMGVLDHEHYSPDIDEMLERK